MSSTQEKTSIVQPESSVERTPARAQSRSVFRRLVLFVGLICTVTTAKKFHESGIPTLSYGDVYSFNQSEPRRCPQSDALVPRNLLWQRIGHTIGSEKYKTRAIDWLAGAVRIPTESYDDMKPPGTDSRWEIFGRLHDYLQSAFPLVHTTLSYTKVNTYGLLYEWKGDAPHLKPILLMSHQDVVPVDPQTVHEWTHPPYSGHFDGSRIWGRGTSDDKCGMISILSAIETMIESGFKPTRTVVLAFGFDEEATGKFGAAELAKVMLGVYGKDSFAFIVDEGGGFSEQYGTIFAVPSIAEKGYLDVQIDVGSPGGHSSVPPSHTVKSFTLTVTFTFDLTRDSKTIGMLSRLVVEIEDHPFPVELSKDDVLYGTLQCYAEHGRTIPSNLRKTITQSSQSKKALKRLGEMLLKDPAYGSLVGTTQAIDLIHGGVKTNALPEQAYAVVNHRISTLSSVKEVMEHDTNTVKALAEKFNLSFTSFGTLLSDPDVPVYGSLSLSDAFGDRLEPAPITPTSGPKARPYELLSGTIKATYNAHRSIVGDNVTVAPGILAGNTDTCSYWDLTGHIFRYNHLNEDGFDGLHTTNEYIEVDTFLEMIRFYVTLIMNAGEADL